MASEHPLREFRNLYAAPHLHRRARFSHSDGRFDTRQVETRNFKGRRTLAASGILLHDDNETVVKERIYLDKSNLDIV
jgi:hypothetical protein